MTTLPAFPDMSVQLHRLWRAPKGFLGWLSAVNHKEIGRRYLATGFVYFLLAGFAALLMRLQLMFPENTFLNAEQYNQLFSTHGTTMMFLFAVPIMQGVGLYFVPLMIGTRDVAFPRMNALGYYVFLFAGIILWGSLLFNSAPNGGWFAYPPLSLGRYLPERGIDVWSVVVTLTEVAALIAATELIVTIYRFRAPGMSLNRMTIFVWAQLFTSFMVIFAMPWVMIGSTELTLDRSISTQFFNSDKGGDPLLWQHLFWFFGHPEVYIIFIPALGMVSEVLAAFTQHKVVGYPFLVLAFAGIAMVSFGLWVHHMFTTGLPALGISFFSAASFMIAIPSAIQIFSSLATLWYGKPVFKTPLLYVIGFVFTFVIGGVSGIMVASLPIDWQVHDTYFVVAHLHYVLIGGAVFPLFAAFYYWFPKVTGRMLDEGLGKLNFWLTLIGFHVAFFPMHISGIRGMTRRIYTYPAGMGWDMLNLVSTLGTFLLGMGLLILVYNVIRSLRTGEAAEDNPWGAGGLEWATTSPPQPYNFDPLPVVHSRYPLWEPPAVRESAIFETHLERREALATTVLDAKPELRVPLPGPTLIPFFTAISTVIIISSLAFSITLFAIGSILLLIFLAIWHWPSAKDRDLAWVKSGPLGALPVSAIAQTLGKHSPYYHGMLIFLVIEFAEILVHIVTYFYLRSGSEVWPQGGISVPDLVLPSVSLAILLASVIPAYLADQAIKKGDQQGLIRYMIVEALLGVIFVALLVYYYIDLPYTWQQNAYVSIFWVLAGFHIVFMVAQIVIVAVLVIWAGQGYFTKERNEAIHVNGLSWYFGAVAFVPIYITLYLMPYLI